MYVTVLIIVPNLYVFSRRILSELEEEIFRPPQLDSDLLCGRRRQEAQGHDRLDNGAGGAVKVPVFSGGGRLADGGYERLGICSSNH